MEKFKTVEQGLLRSIEPIKEGICKIVIDSYVSKEPVGLLAYIPETEVNRDFAGKSVIIQEEVDSQISKEYNNSRNQRIVIGNCVYNLLTSQADLENLRNEALKNHPFRRDILREITYIG